MGSCFSAPEGSQQEAGVQRRPGKRAGAPRTSDAGPGAAQQGHDAAALPSGAAQAPIAAVNGHSAAPSPLALPHTVLAGAGHPHLHQRSRTGERANGGDEDEGEDFLSCRDDFSATDGSHLGDLGPGTPARSGHHHVPHDEALGSRSQRASGAGVVLSPGRHHGPAHPPHDAPPPQQHSPQQQPRTPHHPPGGSQHGADEAQGPVQGSSETDSEVQGEAGRKLGCFSLLDGLSIGRGGGAHEQAAAGAGGGPVDRASLAGTKAGGQGSRRAHERPDAGCSMQPRDKDRSALEVTRCWEDASHSVFNVRSVDYMKTKIKQPSVPALYQLASADIFAFPKKQSHIAKLIQLPPAGQPVMAGDVALPPLLIFNLQLPLYMATLFGPQDGHGVSIVFYFRLPDDFDPAKFENQPALALFKRFVANGREADGTPTRDRLKLIPRVVNVDEWVRKGPLSPAEHKVLLTYNDKPILSRPQHLFFQGRQGSTPYFEVDLDLHQYTFLARRAITTYLQRLPHVIWENAFVVQGNAPDELPEHLLGVARIYKFDFTTAKPIPQRSTTTDGHTNGPPSPSS